MSTATLQSDCTIEPPSWLTTPNSVTGDLATQRESYPLHPFRCFRVNRPIYEDDYQWDSTAIGRWETLAKTLPLIVTRGSIVVESGKPHFKGPPLVECPRCKSKLTKGTAMLTFRHAPPATQEQQVAAWVCSCSEFYVPGEISQEAYTRAFEGPRAAQAPNHSRKNWRKVVGMFHDSEFMRSVDEECQRARDSEREEARREELPE